MNWKLSLYTDTVSRYRKRENFSLLTGTVSTGTVGRYRKLEILLCADTVGRFRKLAGTVLTLYIVPICT
jgi:hypothetical protein